MHACLLVHSQIDLICSTSSLCYACTEPKIVGFQDMNCLKIVLDFSYSWAGKKHFYTVCFYSIGMPKKAFEAFDNISHFYLMRGLQKYARNWDFTMAFWATCKIRKPIWQLFFALPWSVLKKPLWELNFLQIFAIPSSSRDEKCCQCCKDLLWYLNSLETYCV